MRKILLSVDGLSVDDLPDLLELLPALSQSQHSHSAACTFEAPLTSASSAWSQFLTGTFWYESGCYGYSRPNESLNKLSVVREKDLLSPIRLLKNESSDSQSAIVNVPLLLPKSESRSWLSDGSLPIKTKISPSSLSERDVYNGYYARPYIDIGRALGPRAHSAESVLLVETRRTACVSDLLANTAWERCIWRVSATDQLTHLLGTGWLKADDLKCSAGIRELFRLINEQISELLKQSDIEIFLVSMFGHSACLAKFNLNDHLAKGGYLHFDDTSRDASQRIAAAEAVGPKVNPTHLRSSESRLDLKKTLAASPVAGCVFINSASSFSDGPVTTRNHSRICNELSDYLRNTLVNIAPFVKIIENPVPVEQRPHVPLPDLVVGIQGVEFNDVKDSGIAHPPRTTHDFEGFFLLPKQRVALSGSVTVDRILEVLDDF